MTPASGGPFGTMSSGSRQASQYAKELVAAANPCKLLHMQPSGNNPHDPPSVAARVELRPQGPPVPIASPAGSDGTHHFSLVPPHQRRCLKITLAALQRFMEDGLTVF